jgi:hypothetical protein
VTRKILYTIVLLLTSMLAYPYSGRADEKLMEVRYVAGSSQIVLKINDISTPIAQFEILSLIGRKVKVVKHNKGEELVTIQDIYDIPEGIYIIVAKDARGKILSSSKITIAK